MLALGVLTLVSATVATSAPGSTGQAAPTWLAATPLATESTAELSEQLGKITKKVEKVETIGIYILSPIALLVGILALGGGLGIVFSIRDQRRISQLHELSMAGEISSQRRTEQSYASFLEQSQTTIALVNDTLRLAKEASDREARGIESKAKMRVQEVEERAEALMLKQFGKEDFEALIEDQENRHELHAIGEELRTIETSLSFQEVTIPPYAKFVKAIDKFLLDDTEAAIRELQRASQDRQFEDLHRFSLYWLGYMLTTVGEYEEAIRMFIADEIGLPTDDVERLQLERMIAETEFFKVARPSVSRGETRNRETRSPKKRFEDVASVLDQLSALAAQVHSLPSGRDAVIHTSLEIAQTRADVLTWIAYDPDRLDIPLDPRRRAFPASTASLAEADPHEAGREPLDVGSARRSPGPAERFKLTEDWQKLDDDMFRAWSLREAKGICERERKRHSRLNFYVSFALAECCFKLGLEDEAKREFEEAEHLLEEEHGEEREKRGKATLGESLLICHSRLLALSDEDEEQKKKEIRIIRAAARGARQVVQDMRRGRVTVFSQIQRRNIPRDEFTAELRQIVIQEGLGDEDEAEVESA